MLGDCLVRDLEFLVIAIIDLLDFWGGTVVLTPNSIACCAHVR
jgi:hypothetical protein